MQLMKSISSLIVVLMGLLVATNSQAVLINNDEAITTIGYFQVDILAGGESRNARITAVGNPSAIQLDGIEVVFDYFTYVDVGPLGAALRLSSVTSSGPTLINNGLGIDQVDSGGSFLGEAGNTINWTVSSTIEDGSTTMVNTFVFTAVSGSLGDIRVYQYLDEDVLGASSDFFITRGSAATFDLELFTVDNSEAIGVSHSGSLSAGQGLVDGTFVGWAGSQYNEMKSLITNGTQAVSPSGVISAALNAAASVHPVVGPGYGPVDVVSTLTWDVDPLATTATIITTMGGVPVAPVDTTAIGMVVDDADGEVHIFDPATDTVTSIVNVALGSAEGDCAITSDGSLGFVTNFNFQIHAIDLLAAPPALTGGPIPISNYGEDVSLSSDGKFLLVTDGAHNQPISIVDIASLTEIRTFDLTGSTHTSIAVCEDGTVLATSTTGFYSGSIDAAGIITSGSFAPLSRGTNSVCVPGGQTAIGVDIFGGVSSFSLPGLALLDTVSPVSSSKAAVINAAGTRVFIQSEGGITAYDFDPVSGLFSAPVWSTATGEGDDYFGMDQLALHPDGSKLYVGKVSGSARILDPATGADLGVISDVISPLSNPTGICLAGSSAPVNNPPVADAGPDQVVECTATETTVQLDGSASYDPDPGDSIASYLWMGGTFDPNDMVPMPTVDLLLGTHNFDLTVFDTFAAESTDSVEVRVDDTTAPSITAPADINFQHLEPLPNVVALGSPITSDDCDAALTVTNNAPRAFPLGLTVVTWTATDDAGNFAQATQNVTLLNTAPVSDNQNPSVPEDAVNHPITLTASDVNLDDFTYFVVSGPTHGTLGGAAPNLTYTPDGNYFGPDQFTFNATDQHGATGNTATVSIDVTPVNDPPIINISRATATVQYSDTIGKVTITATDVDDDPLALSSEYTDNGGAPIAGLPSNLGTAGSCTTEPNDTASAGTSCSWDLTGQMLEDAGDYDINFTVTDSGGGTATIKSDSGATEIIVNAEDASINFDLANEVAIQVDGDGSDSSLPFSLTVYIDETEPDIATFMAMYGDLSLAVPHMILTPVGPGGPEGPDSCDTSVAGSGDGQVMTYTCYFSGVPVNTYSVDVSVDGGYYSGENDDVVTVYDPSLGFTTGGGWFYWPGTNDKTNFGYTMKYNKKRTNLQGSLLLIRHVEGSVTGEKYRVKSNALNGLAIGSEADFGWASFDGKATYRAPGVENEGNNEFTVYVEDHGVPGKGVDQFWIQTRDKQDDVRIDLSMPEPGAGNTETIEGGNIFVPYTSNGRGK